MENLSFLLLQGTRNVQKAIENVSVDVFDSNVTPASKLAKHVTYFRHDAELLLWHDI
jgi:hypothetical protein